MGQLTRPLQSEGTADCMGQLTRPLQSEGFVWDSRPGLYNQKVLYGTADQASKTRRYCMLQLTRSLQSELLYGTADQVSTIRRYSMGHLTRTLQ